LYIFGFRSNRIEFQGCGLEGHALYSVVELAAVWRKVLPPSSR
jgi:hypothetical protein